MRWRRKVAVTVGGAVISILGTVLAPAVAQDKVRFNLGWTDLGYFVALFVAQQNGYYKEEKLDVTLTYGSGAAQALVQTGAGLFDMAIADVTVGLQAVASKVPIKLVGTYGASSIITFVALKESGINGPKDLEGKKLGGPPADTGIVLLPAFANFSGFDASKVNIINLDAGVRVPALFQRRIDFLVSFDGGSLPILEIEAAKQNRPLTVIRWRDHGYNAMGLGIWGNTTFVAQNPGVVQRFLKATYRGARFMIREPEKAADIYSGMAATLNKEATRSAVKSFAKTFDHPSQAKGLGLIDQADLKTTHDLAVKFSGLTPLDLSTVYTNDFVNASPVLP